MLCKIVNESLAFVVVPRPLKVAKVTALLKKSSLNCEDMKNYPANLQPSIYLEIIEKVVKHLDAHMAQYHCHEYFQSTYREYHSTETALLRVHNDICQAINDKKCVYVVLLDLSTAFDMFQHSVLLRRYEGSLGISDSALNWCRSYFIGGNQSSNILSTSSVPKPFTSGMPQGSVMGPFGFPSYTGPVGRICQKHGIPYHFYPDDSQLYVAFDPKDEEAKGSLEACINDIHKWIKRNFLKLNDSKIDFLIMGSGNQV